LDGVRGSTHKLTQVGTVWVLGHMFKCYLHLRVRDVGVLVRGISNDTLQLVMYPCLTSKDHLEVEFKGRDGGIYHTTTFMTVRPWNVSSIKSLLKAELYEKHMKSPYEYIELKFEDGDNLNSGVKIWDPSWQVPKGNTSKVLKRVTGKRKPSPARTMDFYLRRKK
jgi:hypothetical protein